MGENVAMCYNMISTKKKEFLIFLAVTYGLPFLMAIPIEALFRAGKEVASFPLAQMQYPAAGLILAKLICEKKNPLLPQKFFIGFLVLTGIMVLWCFSGFFLPDGIPSTGIDCLGMIGSIVLISLFFSEEKKKRKAYRLAGKNWGLSVLLLALYVVLNSIGAVVVKTVVGLDEHLSCSIISLPLMFVLLSVSFFGEEYGWRTYFQPLLQKKFGLVKGILLFGVLWEFWHLPLVFFYYSPTTPNISLAQLIVYRYFFTTLLAIFMAYAYMKTQNIWLPAMIHFVTNSIEWIGTVPGDETITWEMLGIIVLIKSAMYLPFLFTKTFRQQKIQ